MNNLLLIEQSKDKPPLISSKCVLPPVVS